MKVREVIKDAARLIGDESLYSALDDETTALTGDNLKKTDVYLKCYNDAQFEVATKYLPIIAEETFGGGKILYKSFKHTPSKILRVREHEYQNRQDPVRLCRCRFLLPYYGQIFGGEELGKQVFGVFRDFAEKVFGQDKKQEDMEVTI